MLTLGGDDELDFRTPRRLEILACTADSAALHDYAHQVDHRNLEAELTRRKLGADHPGRSRRWATAGDHDGQPAGNPRAASAPADAQGDGTGAVAQPCSTRSPVAADGRVHRPVAPPAGGGARARLHGGHIDGPITVADLCIELGIFTHPAVRLPGRARSQPGSFPARDPRLNAVRRALKAADPMVAARSPTSPHAGAARPARFSAEYRAILASCMGHAQARGLSRRGGRKMNCSTWNH